MNRNRVFILLGVAWGSLAAGCQSKIESSAASDPAVAGTTPEAPAPVAPVDPSTTTSTGSGTTAAAAFEVTERSPVVVGPGASVTLAGKGFTAELKAAVLGLIADEAVAAQLTVTSAESATVTMPSANGAGAKPKIVSLALSSGGVEQKIDLVFTAGLDDLPFMTAAPADVCAGVEYYDAQGVKRVGTKTCGASAPTACTSDGQQNCLASGGFFAARACAAGDSTCFLPAYAASTQPLKALDFDDIAAKAPNFRSGTTIAGVAGDLDDCAANGVTGCVTTSTYKSADLTNLLAGNIKSGVTVAGQLGNFTGGATFDALVPSTIHRDVGTTQMTLATEKATSSYGAGFREIPNIFKDDTAFWNTAAGCTGAGGQGHSCTNAIWATRPSTPCGTTQATVAARVSDCATQNGAAASWNGQTNGLGAEANWTLVTYDGTYEVWRDERTGLLWSDRAPSNDNWCKASGNAQSDDPSGLCNNVANQDQTTPVSYCVEAGTHQPGLAGENWTTGVYHAVKGGMGAVATASSPAVRWRLPTRADWMQADVDGVKQVLPNIAAAFWTATIYDSLRQRANYFIGNSGTHAATSTLANVSRNQTNAIRCVGRP